MSRLGAALLGGGATLASSVLLRAAPPGGPQRWERANFRDRRVSLLGGVASAAGSVAAALGAGGRAGAAAALVAGTGGVLGAIDDLDPGATASKGLRGHLGALARGELTTGALKLLGIGSAAVVAAGIGTGFGARSAVGRSGAGALAARTADVVASGALVAGTANLVNLFDLRPGRGLKVVGALSVPLAVAGGPGAPLATGALGVVAASWSDDLAERTMLGDTGANALGGLVGTSLALLPGTRPRTVALAAVVGLTLLSEKVSFSRVIASTPGLREADAWGREA